MQTRLSELLPEEEVVSLDLFVGDPLMRLQVESEELFHRNSKLPRMREDFLSNPELVAIVDGLEPGVPRDFSLDLLCQMALHRQADVSTIVGILRRHFDDPQAVADALKACVEADLVDLDLVLRDRKPVKRLVLVWDVGEDVKEDLRRYQYPLPTVVPPAEIRSNSETGYHRYSRGSVILRDNHHDGDACLDHINRMNRIRLRVDRRVSLYAANAMRSPERRPGEDPRKHRERKASHDNFTAHAHDVMERIGIVSDDSSCWLTHRYDFRGRTYCQGYYVTYQGRDWNKAIVHFANEEIVT